jgi:hypothetical protein
MPSPFRRHRGGLAGGSWTAHWAVSLNALITSAMRKAAIFLRMKSVGQNPLFED